MEWLMAYLFWQSYTNIPIRKLPKTALQKSLLLILLTRYSTHTTSFKVELLSQICSSGNTAWVFFRGSLIENIQIIININTYFLFKKWF